jgi:hypothetical protein
VAFEAISRREANELCKEQWFRDELLSLRSDNQRIWDGKETLTVGPADQDEIRKFHNAQAASSNNDDDGLVLAYLVPLDGVG